MTVSFSTISVVGLGYIGLPTAAVFAAHKVKVIGVDVNQNAVDTINKGKIHIVEPDLDVAVNKAVSEGYLKATTVAEPADAFLIAVPTPFKNGHEPDLSYIESASKSIAPVLKKGDLVVLESTSPVGTTEMMAEWLAASRPDLTFPQQKGEDSDIRIAHCPERVLPGHVLRELLENGRIIGGMTAKCSESATALYKTFVAAECITTDARTAEMCKLTENSFRDVNIAFANELSIICDRLGINVWELISLANRHPRVNILQPGCGVGGHCIAVDPWFIVHKTPEEAKLIGLAREINDNKPYWLCDKVQASVQELVEKEGKKRDEIKIACFGLAFKPDIDDLRESPAMQITAALAEKFNNQVVAVEPNIDTLPSRMSAVGVHLADVDIVKTADIIVLLVDHKQFKEIKPVIRKNQRLIDAKGIWD